MAAVLPPNGNRRWKHRDPRLGTRASASRVAMDARASAAGLALAVRFPGSLAVAVIGGGESARTSITADDAARTTRLAAHGRRDWSASGSGHQTASVRVAVGAGAAVGA